MAKNFTPIYLQKNLLLIAQYWARYQIIFIKGVFYLLHYYSQFPFRFQMNHYRLLYHFSVPRKNHLQRK